MGSNEILSSMVSALFIRHNQYNRTFDVGRSYEQQGGGPFSWQRQLGVERCCVNLVLALPVSFAAGLASGMVGVGGGILKVPMMVLPPCVPGLSLDHRRAAMVYGFASTNPCFCLPGTGWGSSV